MDSYRSFRTDRQAIPKCQKSSGTEDWLSRDLLDLRKRRKIYGHKRQGQATWEEYRDAGHYCRDEIPVSKA